MGEEYRVKSRLNGESLEKFCTGYIYKGGEKLRVEESYHGFVSGVFQCVMERCKDIEIDYVRDNFISYDVKPGTILTYMGLSHSLINAPKFRIGDSNLILAFETLTDDDRFSVLEKA